MHALGLEFGSAAQLSKRPGSVWNCLWGNALKRSPGIIRKSRVSYPGPGFLSSATWSSLPKKHYNGLNQTKHKTIVLANSKLSNNNDLPTNLDTVYETKTKRLIGSIRIDMTGTMYRADTFSFKVDIVASVRQLWASNLQRYSHNSTITSMLHKLNTKTPSLYTFYDTYSPCRLNKPQRQRLSPKKPWCLLKSIGDIYPVSKDYKLNSLMSRYAIVV